MKINNLSEHNCIINRYLAEMRDCDYQKNRLLFRNNIKRIGEYEAFEISKTLNYENRDVTTPPVIHLLPHLKLCLKLMIQ